MTRRRPGDYCRSCVEKDLGQKSEAKVKVVYAYSKKAASSRSNLLNPYYVAQRPGEDEDFDEDEDDENFDDEDEDFDDDNFEEEDDEEDRREERS